MKTDRTKLLPKFPTQVIGSLPRPELVLHLVQQKKNIAAAEYKAAMDDMVRFAIRLQEQAGLDVISDGEWRRTQYIGEFLNRIGSFEPVAPYQHAGETKMRTVVVRKIEKHDPVFTEDAEFLVKHTDRCTKFALPSPFLIAVRYWDETHSKDAYPTIEHLMDDLAGILRREAEALAAAGIDVIQLDDPALTYFCDRKLTESGDTHDDRLRRKWDIESQLPEAIGFLNKIVEGLKAEVHLHCCHSVYKRQSDVTGNYEPILPGLADAKIDCVNLEFAYHGTGDASDLKLLPDQLAVGMGVVDVRGEQLQTVEEIEAIGAAGVEFISADRIKLNPDCGFAPDSHEPPTIDEAFVKLSRMSEAAKRLRRRFA